MDKFLCLILWMRKEGGMMKAYKGFHKDLTCTLGNGVFQYKENEWIEESEASEANCAKNGFHCCYNPLDCLSYYHGFNSSIYYLVNAAGDIHENGSDTKIACTRIKLIKKLSIEEFVAHALIYMAERPYLDSNHFVKRESAYGKASAGFQIVRGKQPRCMAPVGTVVGMVQEAANSKEIVAMTVYKVDGIRYLPNTAYLVNGEVAIA